MFGYGLSARLVLNCYNADHYYRKYYCVMFLIHFKTLISKLPHEKLAKNTLLSLFWQSARIVTLMLWVIILARNFGAKGYGDFSGIAGLATTIGSFTGCGFGLLMYRNTIQDQNVFCSMWAKTLKMTLISGILLSLGFVVVGMNLFVSASIKLLIPIALSEILFYPFVTGGAFALIAKYKMGWSTSLPAFSGMLKLFAVLIYTLTVNKPQLEEYLIFHTVATLAAAIFSILLVSQILKPQKTLSNISWKDINQGLGYCISWASSNAITSIDKTIILRISNSEIAGFYSTAYRFATIFMQPIDAFINAAMPKLFLRKKNPSASKISLTLLFSTICCYSLLAGFILFFLPDVIIYILGDSFYEAAIALRWFSLLLPCYGLRLLSTNILLANNNIMAKFIIELTGILVMFLLGLLLIPIFGLLGAVFMIIFTEALIALISTTFAIMLTHTTTLMPTERL